LVDVFRATYPKVTGAFTCWNVAAGAQLTNHGSRIDYFLVDPDFARRVTRCGIAQSHPGSDHCPVFITVAAPEEVLRNAERDDATRASASSPLPSLVSSVTLARAGRQARLTGFFRKGAPRPAAAAESSVATRVPVGAKRKGDVSIRSFFARKRAGGDDAGGGSGGGERVRNVAAEATTATPTETFLSGELQRRLRNRGPPESPADPAALLSTTATASKETVDAWRRIQERQKPPRCRGHGEPAKVRKVTKAGPNFGRVFFACPRPAGDRANGGDCGFFQWAYDRK
jgi:AP endonuclease-2